MLLLTRATYDLYAHAEGTCEDTGDTHSVNFAKQVHAHVLKVTKLVQERAQSSYTLANNSQVETVTRLLKCKKHTKPFERTGDHSPRIVLTSSQKRLAHQVATAHRIKALVLTDYADQNDSASHLFASWSENLTGDVLDQGDASLDQGERQPCILALFEEQSMTIADTYLSRMEERIPKYARILCTVEARSILFAEANCSMYMGDFLTSKRDEDSPISAPGDHLHATTLGQPHVVVPHETTVGSKVDVSPFNLSTFSQSYVIPDEAVRRSNSSRSLGNRSVIIEQPSRRRTRDRGGPQHMLYGPASTHIRGLEPYTQVSEQRSCDQANMRHTMRRAVNMLQQKPRSDRMRHTLEMKACSNIATLIRDAKEEFDALPHPSARVNTITTQAATCSTCTCTPCTCKIGPSVLLDELLEIKKGRSYDELDIDLEALTAKAHHACAFPT
jgi:hypothetical protein